MNTACEEKISGVYIPPLFDELKLGACAFRLYAHILTRAKDGSCEVSVSDMAKVCRMNRKTVIKTIQELKAHRVVTIERRPGLHGRITPTDVSQWIQSPEPSHAPIPGWVYLIHATGTSRFKIGFASSPDKRLVQLSEQSPFPLTMVCSYPSADAKGSESFWHKLFEQKRVHGEWFELTDEQVLAFRDSAIAEGGRA
jgi:hypothetical protein